MQKYFNLKKLYWKAMQFGNITAENAPLFL
jgi:hypothetical protein